MPSIHRGGRELPVGHVAIAAVVVAVAAVDEPVVVVVDVVMRHRPRLPRLVVVGGSVEPRYPHQRAGQEDADNLPLPEKQTKVGFY